MKVNNCDRTVNDFDLVELYVYFLATTFFSKHNLLGIHYVHGHRVT